MDKQREKTTNDENGNENENNNNERDQQDNGGEGSSQTQESGDNKAIDSQNKKGKENKRWASIKNWGKKKLEMFATVVGMTFILLPFWIFVAILLIASQFQLEKISTKITDTLHLGLSVYLTLTFLAVIILAMLIFFIFSIAGRSTQYMSLNSSAFFGNFFICATTGLVYLQTIEGYNDWKINAIILYSFVMSVVSAYALVALYKWLFLEGELNENVQLKLSFLNKVLASGFGLIATILGIALTLKNLFS